MYYMCTTRVPVYWYSSTYTCTVPVNVNVIDNATLCTLHVVYTCTRVWYAYGHSELEWVACYNSTQLVLILSILYCNNIVPMLGWSGSIARVHVYITHVYLCTGIAIWNSTVYTY